MCHWTKPKHPTWTPVLPCWHGTWTKLSSEMAPFDWSKPTPSDVRSDLVVSSALQLARTSELLSNNLWRRCLLRCSFSSFVSSAGNDRSTDGPFVSFRFHLSTEAFRFVSFRFSCPGVSVFRCAFLDPLAVQLVPETKFFLDHREAQANGGTG